jgi:phage/plasmid-associated DNA primase
MDSDTIDLINEIKENSEEKTSGITYMVLNEEKENLLVPFQKLPYFMEKYCNLAYNDINNEIGLNIAPEECGLCIAEVVNSKNTPLISNLTLGFQTNDEENPVYYENDFILSTISAIQSVMLDKLNIGNKMAELICCVLESKPWSQGPFTFINVKLQFPFAQIDNNYQKRVIHPAIINALINKRVINLLKMEPIGNWSNIYGEMLNFVPLYRSKFESNHAPMILTHIYENIELDSINEEALLNIIFIPSHHTYIHNKFMPNITLNNGNELDYWLPLFLSLNYWAKTCTPKIDSDMSSISGSITGSNCNFISKSNYINNGSIKGNVIKNEKLNNGRNSPKSIINFEDDDITSKCPKIMLKYLLPLLSLERYIREDYWLDIGRAIYTITDGSEEGFNLWASSSLRSGVLNRDKIECSKHYYSLRNTGININTIGWFARQDSRIEYDKWHTAWCGPALNNALSLIDCEVAEAIHRVLWLDHSCTDAKDSWRKFIGHKYEHAKGALYLRRDINDIIIPIYRKMRVDSSQQSIRNDKDINQAEIDKYIMQLGKLTAKLGNNTFRNSLIATAQEKFYDKDFEKYKDNNATKTGWKNGIIECCGNNAYFKPGKPQDYITMNTGIVFDAEMSWNHPLVLELMEWLGKVFVDEELLKYFLKVASSHLIGRNSDKLFSIWTGDGNNSKSMVVKLFKATMGQYCVDFPISMLCKSFGNASGPSPELAQSKGAHTGIVAEPDADEELQAGKIKRFTGGDALFARMCCENGGSFEAFVKLIFMCNGIPNIPGVDNAVKERFQIIPFLSTWVKNADPNCTVQYERREFQMDPFFENRIPELSQAFAWVMVQFFNVYKEEGLKIPKIVIDCNVTHWKANDVYLNFMDDKVENVYINSKEIEENSKIKDSPPIKPVKDVKATISATDLYPVFLTWFKNNFPGQKPVPSAKFKTEMLTKDRMGPQLIIRNRWVGVSIKNDATTSAIGA